MARATLGTRAHVHKAGGLAGVRTSVTSAGTRSEVHHYCSQPMNVALAAAATLVALAFAASTFDRWSRRRRPHELAWTISLLLFALGSGAMWWAEGQGWSVASFRVFYLAGAILNVPWLALGTVHLLAGGRAGTITQRCVVAVSWFSAGIVLVAPTKTGVAGAELPTGKDVFGAAPRILAAVGSGVSAIVIVAGAVWSAWRLWRRRPANPARSTSAPGRLALGNVLIAVGTIVLSASGTLAGRLGKDRAFVVTLLTGIVILFAGFLVAPSSRVRTPVTRLAVDGSPSDQ